MIEHKDEALAAQEAGLVLTTEQERTLEAWGGTAKLHGGDG